MDQVNQDSSVKAAIGIAQITDLKSAGWTDERHTVYISSMESSFIHNQLYKRLASSTNAMKSWPLRPSPLKNDQLYNHGHNTNQKDSRTAGFKVLKGGMRRKVEYDRRTNAYVQVRAKGHLPESPLIHNFRTRDCSSSTRVDGAETSVANKESSIQTITGRTLLSHGMELGGCNEEDLLGENTASFIDDQLCKHLAPSINAMEPGPSCPSSLKNDQLYNHNRDANQKDLGTNGLKVFQGGVWRNVKFQRSTNACAQVRAKRCLPKSRWIQHFSPCDNNNRVRGDGTETLVAEWESCVRTIPGKTLLSHGRELGGCKGEDHENTASFVDDRLYKHLASSINAMESGPSSHSPLKNDQLYNHDHASNQKDSETRGLKVIQGGLCRKVEFESRTNAFAQVQAKWSPPESPWIQQFGPRDGAETLVAHGKELGGYKGNDILSENTVTNFMEHA